MLIYCTALIGLFSGLFIGFTDAADAPVLTKTPDYPVYVLGEEVTLQCGEHGGENNKFTFQKDFQFLRSQNSAIYHIPSIQFTHRGSYTCDYWDGSNNSPRSNTIALFVLGPLPSSKIHLNPLRPLYTGGEQVTVRCEPPNSYKVQKIQFYKDGIVIDRDKDLHRDDSYTVSTYGHEAAGDYSCAYWVKLLERDVKSDISEKVTIKTEGFTTPLSTTLTSTVTEAKTSKDPISTTTRLTTEHLHADNLSLAFSTLAASDHVSDTALSTTLNFTEHLQNKSQYLDNSVLKLIAQQLIYTIGGAGLFILVVTIFLVLLRTCRKGKSKYHEPAPFPVQENNAASNLRLHQINASVPDAENESTWPQNAVSLQDNEDAAQIHTYCEIDPFLPAISSSVQLPQSSALAYSTVQAVPLLPTVYQRNLQPNH